MKSSNWDDALLAEYRARIRSESAQRAFDTLVASAVTNPHFVCEPGRHGAVRNFRYLDPTSDEWPFSFIINRSDLLFYVRETGKRQVPGGFSALQRALANVHENPRGEWTVHIRDTADARSLLAVLFGAGVTTGTAWTEAEVRILVADYFDMLRLERQGLPYSKADHNAALQARLPGRSRGSIEYKHQNVSGVLYDENFPFLDGYKPALNYQRRLLPDIVFELLESGDAAVQAIKQASEVVVAPIEARLDFSACEVAAPDLGTSPARNGVRQRYARKYDYAARDDKNRKLGRAGEEFILRREQWFLRSVGREDLVRRIDWVSDTRGDGLGYDLVSYSPETEKEVFIEVKTTNSGERFPFYVTHSEVEVAEELGGQYRLSRVFNFSTRPQFYSVAGNLREAFHLSPRLFEARR